MADNEWVTVSEASEKVNIPVETIRRYIRSHSVHLKVKKLGKKYSIHNDSMTVIKRIRSLYDQGKNSDEVEESLSASGIPMTFTVKNDDSDETMTVHVADELKLIKQALAEHKQMYEEQRQTSDELKQNIDKMQSFMELLWTDYKKQSEQINQLVDIVSQDPKLLNQSKPILDSVMNDNKKAEIEAVASENEKEVAAGKEQLEKKGFWKKFFGK